MNDENDRSPKRPPDAHCRFNPRSGHYVATSADGPLADELFGQGDTEEEALDSMVEGLRKRGAL
jgi:hypothetical protein